MHCIKHFRVHRPYNEENVITGTQRENKVSIYTDGNYEIPSVLFKIALYHRMPVSVTGCCEFRVTATAGSKNIKMSLVWSMGHN